MLAQLSFNINNEFFKYVVVALTSPWWLPFFKALIQDFNDALRDEGGLLGYAPTDSKLSELNRERGTYDSVLVSEPYPGAGGVQSRSASRSTPTRATSTRGAAPGPQAPSSRPGFRDPSERSKRSGFS